MKDHEKTTGWGGPREKSNKVKRIHDRWCKDNGYPVPKRMKIKKNAYAALGECIVTDQVPAHKVAMYFDDEDFLKWYRNRYFFPRNKHHAYFKKYPKETSHKDWLKGYWKWKKNK